MKIQIHFSYRIKILEDEIARREEKLRNPTTSYSYHYKLLKIAKKKLKQLEIDYEQYKKDELVELGYKGLV